MTKQKSCIVCGKNSYVKEGWHINNKHHFELDFCSNKCVSVFLYNTDMFSNLSSSKRWQIDLRYDERKSVKAILHRQEKRISKLEKEFDDRLPLRLKSRSSRRVM